MADPYEAMTGLSTGQRDMMFVQDSEEDMMIEAPNANYEDQLESFIRQCRNKVV